jgi:DNA-binding transcriptional ArsR family regulator
MLGAKHGADMTLDDIILKALDDGPVTVKDIVKRLERRVRVRLDKLRVRGVVVREGRGGANRQFTYRLLRPDLAAKALGEKGGGLSRFAKVDS